VTEYSGSVTVIQSIQLPDTSTYQFTYDNGTYGEMTGVTLPTSGSVSYGYTTYADPFGNRNRWVNSYTAGGGTWNYSQQTLSTCPNGFSFCQKNTVTKPSGDTIVYTFGLNNGAWAAEVDTNSGTSTLLSSAVTTWNTSSPCPLTGCTGAAYIQQQTLTTSLPTAGAQTLNKAVQYTFASQFNRDITQISEWNFYIGSQPTTPDRTTSITYNSFNKPLVTAVTDGSQTTTYSQTSVTYDSYGSNGLTSVTGVTQHDDTNYGVSNTNRGNPTAVQRLVSGSGSSAVYATTALTYDTTGQVRSVKDPAGNTTSESYSDSFYDDAATSTTHSVSTPTNAYLTQVTHPTVGSNNFVSNFSYYYGTGQAAKSTDVNGQVI
jgi:hypothetical protein